MGPRPAPEAPERTAQRRRRPGVSRCGASRWNSSNAKHALPGGAPPAAPSCPPCFQQPSACIFVLLPNRRLALATAYDEAEDRECSNILLALSGQPGASVASRSSGTTTARPSVHSGQAAAPPATVPVPVVAVAAQFGFPIAPAAAGAFMEPSGRETALPRNGCMRLAHSR